MTASKVRPPIPAIALAEADAAAAVGVGSTLFREHIAPDLRVIRIKSRVLYPVAELERWVDQNARQTLGSEAR